ncbi:MAG: tRNA (5-methylaminomethyl-2-thiouridylate)-methyltransferase [Magnetococcales bacterium]|nr:tRNA (5-methylaminomethyl-2-thiouridylate)-methyltransferase [Magnetococcales bacterium]
MIGGWREASPIHEGQRTFRRVTKELQVSPIRALGLLSGGLDSTLAARLLQEQGIHVECVNFYTGFCIQSHTGAIRNPKEGAPPPRHDALHAAQSLGIKLHMVDISEPYVQIVTQPRYGYGKNLNPCLDCKVFMVKKAMEIKEKLGFHFLFTGEVVGQRPMSQRKSTLPVIARDAGAQDWLLRPLCALRLPITEPEKRGWVDRSRLLGFSGRTRTPQMDLAAHFNIVDYPSPAGGCCFLTDENYASRLRDLWHSRGDKQYTLDDILLLKAGRHLRPDPAYKVIIGRDETENNFLAGFRRGRIAIHAPDVPGPLALVEGIPDHEALTLLCRLVARYGKGRHQSEVKMEIAREELVTCRMVNPLSPEAIPDAWYI